MFFLGCADEWQAEAAARPEAALPPHTRQPLPAAQGHPAAASRNCWRGLSLLHARAQVIKGHPL